MWTRRRQKSTSTWINIVVIFHHFHFNQSQFHFSDTFRTMLGTHTRRIVFSSILSLLNQCAAYRWSFFLSSYPPTNMRRSRWRRRRVICLAHDASMLSWWTYFFGFLSVRNRIESKPWHMQQSLSSYFPHIFFCFFFFVLCTAWDSFLCCIRQACNRKIPQICIVRSSYQRRFVCFACVYGEERWWWRRQYM